PKLDRRKKKRLTIDQINLMGDEQLREHLAKIREPEDKRTTFMSLNNANIGLNIGLNIERNRGCFASKWSAR
ncbi:hypothetical protein LCGC14_2121120, partial [marine sediment metagenome]